MKKILATASIHLETTLMNFKSRIVRYLER